MSGGGRDQAELARECEEHRGYLRRVAYSTLGSLSDADDVVQEAWLRLVRYYDTSPEDAEIENLRAWLTTVTGRLALDHLGSARARREQYVGEWLPEPEITTWDDPADRISQDERVTTALLVVLESLSPAERTAFVLQDVFGMTGPEVAEVVGRTPAAVRQLASRARKHVENGTPRFPASPDEHEKVVSAFAVAWRSGDLSALLGVLDSNVTFTSDGGGKVQAFLHPMHGAEKVAQTLLGFLAVASDIGGAWGRSVLVNGRPGLVVFDGKNTGVFSFTIDEGRITKIDVVRNPDKIHLPDDAEPDWPLGEQADTRPEPGTRS
ncbi:RNA polymerase sigma factor SigJ [Nocardia seriolae]|uniref:ECF RNA polymerase sigma factor SigJ n=1 Tax=Nocardia seriolae TaxID=37332 RepID=A0A0B8NNS1_9NOCA|nr:RNA polymerase sigma factor SigJ [Nocardia seriolae]APA97151.1 ECF RNA polymerase sigma factor SigJ [Nocardia seriolae]MTJ65068.1 sigma-70 family RNA polymerase sigma factor [Nocardia seriolae]MTJ75021.1 sigma-70 family RNA polymerase sigma factor [Nocardia seriolae]MTJ87007.1 sigma-70 family RNA polymerase sigma factor [Nocardia seriolae]MTK31003.1 sigma-70 family RNA polymerase sigma factor [Nocardia seriolae]